MASFIFPAWRAAAGKVDSQVRGAFDTLIAASVAFREQFPKDRESGWLLCWVLKDLGWIMYFGPLAWAAALAALVMQVQSLPHASNSIVNLAHGIVSLAWLIGSSIWMSVDLLFEPEAHKSRTSPWHTGAIVSASPAYYHRGVQLMQFIQTAALLGIIGFYATQLKVTGKSKRPTSDAIRERRQALEEARSSSSDGSASPLPESLETQKLLFGMIEPEVYAKLFIVPWILKDLFWSTRCFIPAVLCSFLVVVLMADYLFLFMQWKNLAMLFWSTGTAVYIAHDLVMHEEEIWPMMLSLLLFVAAAGILGAQFVRSETSEKAAGYRGKVLTIPRSPVFSEAEPLLSGDGL